MHAGFFTWLYGKASRRPVRRWRLLTKCLLVLICGSTVLAWSIQALMDAHPPLRVAMNPWPGYEFATLALEQGYFADEGVDVRLIDQFSLGDTRRTFERGQVDGFFGTVVEVLQSHATSDRIAQIVLVTDYSSGADVIVAHPSIRSMLDLRGKRVGVEEGSLGEYVLARALDLAGMEWSDVERVHLPTMQMPDAFRQELVAAVVVYPPASDELKRDGQVHTVFDTRQIPGEVVDVLAFDQAVLSARGDDVAAFLRGFARAQAFARTHPDEALRFMASRERTSVDDLQHNLTNGLHIVEPGDQQHFLGSRGTLHSVIDRTRRVLTKSTNFPNVPGESRIIVYQESI